MSNILIVGNVTKDVYLNLDDTTDTFEEDGTQTAWLDLSFDGSKHHFTRRTSVLGGAAISLEVLSNLGQTVEIVEQKAIFRDGEVVLTGNAPCGYRYILGHNNQVAYFTAKKRFDTKWTNPHSEIDWIYIDRSAVINAELVQMVKKYLSMSQQTRLAVYVKPEQIVLYRELIKDASLIFSDHKIPYYTGNYFYFNDNQIVYQDKIIHYRQTRRDLTTHLTIYSAMSATLFGMLLNGKNLDEALLAAKISAEKLNLSRGLKFDELEEYMVQNRQNQSDIRLLAANLVAKDKGILAADESGGSIHKKFEQAGIPDDESHRRDYRNIFFTTPNLEKYVNGVILFDETARQKADDGRNFVDFLTARGIIPGIKVDQGLENFPNSEEKWTKGLEGLPERLAEYYEMGLRFAKWRAAFEISFHEDGSLRTPTDFAIQKNCEILAKYARDCQQAGIVPIVEPEVVYDGYYTIEQNAEITGKILQCLFEELSKKEVALEGCLLKCNMVLAGKKYETQSTPEEVGEATAKVLRENVPAALAGVVFLSGGQSVEQATANLQAVTNNGPFEWPVTFSFARALQDPALEAWQGNNDNIETAREAFAARLKANCEALER